MDAQTPVEAPRPGTIVIRLADEKPFEIVDRLHEDQSFWYVHAMAADGETTTLEIQHLYGPTPTFAIETAG